MLRQTFKVFLCLVGCVVRWWVHGIKTPCFPWPGPQSVNSTIEGGRVFQQQGARIKIPDEPDWVWSWESTRCVVSWLLPAGVLTHRPSGARRLVAGPPVIAVQWFQLYYRRRWRTLPCLPAPGPVVSAVLPWTMTDSALPPRSWLSARPTCNCLVGLYLFFVSSLIFIWPNITYWDLCYQSFLCK